MEELCESIKHDNGTPLFAPIPAPTPAFDRFLGALVTHAHLLSFTVVRYCDDNIFRLIVRDGVIYATDLNGNRLSTLVNTVR